MWQNLLLSKTIMIVSSYKGIAWFIMSLIISASNDITLKYLSFTLPTWEMVFFRFFFGTITLIPFIFFYGIKSIISSKPLLHVVRGLILAFAISFWIKGLSVNNIVVATVMTFTIPIFILIFSSIMLKEKISLTLWILSITGMIGIITILNPKEIKFNINAFSLIFAAGLFGLLDIINKQHAIKESILSILFYSSLVTTTISMIFLILEWKNPSVNDLILLLIVGSGSNGILFCLLKSYQLISFPSIVPLRFLELPLSMMLGNLIFHETPKIYFFLGTIMIIFSTCYICNISPIQNQSSKVL